MKNCVTRWMILLALLLVSATGAFAQKYEIHPYAGGMFLTDFKADPDQIGRFDFKNPGVFGLKGGVFLTQNFQIEGNAGYLNSFKFRNHVDPKIRAGEWEALGSYNFGAKRFKGVFPYASLGLGAISLHVNSPINHNTTKEAVYVVQVPPTPVPGSPFSRTVKPFIVTDGDAFFTISYGGGIKAQRLWGPLGFRVDLRGRTMPNFYNHQTVHGFEPTAGLLFSWGER